MGCKNTKVKEDDKPAADSDGLNSTGGSLTATKRAEMWETILSSLLQDAEQFVTHLDVDSESLKLTQMKIFLNSLVEVLRQTVRLKFDSAREAIRAIATKDPQHMFVLKALPEVEERVVDDGYSRLLTSWMTKVNTTTSCFDAIVSSLRSVEVFLDDQDIDEIRKLTGTLDPLSAGSFLCVLQRYTKMALSNPAVNELFTQTSSNKELITVADFCGFIREFQSQENISERSTLDKVRNRFGGYVTKLNFGSYLNGLITNSALDPQRAATVWQDMTQPLPRYMVSTARILDEASLSKAIHDGVRSFVLVCTEEHGEIFSGTCAVRTILEEIKAHGFTENAYPIVVCLAPDHPISVDLQDRLAALITDTLGTMLAKGIMFEGAVLSDPGFSPAALQHKILIMGSQAPLKPFVGFLVADMNRDGLGVRVTDVKSSTPASKAGILKDDWLTHINGHPILNKQHLREQLATLRLGDEFTMRKENLDEVRVIVGGAVTHSDENNSMKLSNLVFLKILAETDENHKFPWETSAVMSDELDSTSYDADRKGLGDHFLFVSPVRNSSSDYVGVATWSGAQFVEAGADSESHIWSRGLFSENAHCGYILKSDEHVASPGVEVTINILAPPPHLTGATLCGLKVRTHGPVNGTTEGSKAKFTDFSETSVGVVVAEWERNGQSFHVTSSFPLLLLREGYRVLPGLMTVDELCYSPSTVGTYCRITIARGSS